MSELRTTLRSMVLLAAACSFVAVSCASSDGPAGSASVPIATGSPQTAPVTAGGAEITTPILSTPVTVAGDASTTPTTPTSSSTVSVTAASTPGSRPTSTTPPDPASVQLTSVASVRGALDLAWRTGGDDLYVVGKGGEVDAVRNGVASVVLSIPDEVSTGSEQGLLGLTFSLDGTTAYVDLTNPDGDTEIVEYAVSPDGTFDPGSRRLLLTIDQPYSNHNGGQVRIGRDGLLYIATGDGGSGGDPQRRAMDGGELLGKILRIDPRAQGGAPYGIPADNPFVGVDGARAELWSIGLRNPWRFSWDRATDDLWIADVGQGEWEEIDVAWADEGGGRGANFGWSAFEGSHRFNTDQSDADVVAPIWEYEHGARGCSVSGGVRYRGAAIPALYGYYVYGDYCSGEIHAIEIRDDRTAGVDVVLANVAGLSEIAQGPDGELYTSSVDAGMVTAIVPVG